MDESFYVSSGGGSFVATELTRGPWDPGSQHAGPPSALLGREIEAMEGSEEFQVGRIVFEILRPVPIGPVQVETRVLRPGRKVRMVEASLSGEAGELMRATAWQLRTTELELPAGALAEEERRRRALRKAGFRSSFRLGRTPATTRRWS